MIERARKPAPVRAVPEEALSRKRPTPTQLVSLKATHGEKGAAVKAAPLGKPGNHNASMKPRQKPTLKLAFALKLIRENLDYARNGYREKLYVAYAEACALAYRLKQNLSEWKAFCDLPIWKQREKFKQKLQIKNALYLVLVVTAYGLSRLQKQTASKVSIALKAYADDAYDTQDIVDFIKRSRGIAQLARQNAAPKPEKKPRVCEASSAPARTLEVGLMGGPLAGFLKHKPNTKFRIEAVMMQDANGRKFLKCLSVHKI